MKIFGVYLRADRKPLSGVRWSSGNTLTMNNNENNEEQLKLENAKENLCVYLFRNSYQKKRLRPLGLKGLEKGASPC